jgi:hypothetical protein
LPTTQPTIANAVTIDTNCFHLNEHISVHFANPLARTDDWIGIFPADTKPDKLDYPLMWLWSCGSQECKVAGSSGTLIFGPDNPNETGQIAWPLPGGAYVLALVNRNDAQPYTIGAISEIFLVDSTNNCAVNGPNFDAPSAAPSSAFEGVLLAVALEGGDEFADPTSYQSQAYYYVMHFAGIESCSDEEIVDMYALASLYYASYQVPTEITLSLFNEPGESTPPWKDNTRWVGNTKPCDTGAGTWFGVKCDADGRVTKVDLSDNSLTGRLPAEISLLDEIKVLNFYHNYLFNDGQKELSWLGDLGDIGTYNVPLFIGTNRQQRGH